MKNTLLFLALLLSVCSCHKSHNGFNEKVIISPYEEKDNNFFTFICHTDRTYSCNSGAITTTAVVNGKDIVIAFKAVTLSGCSSAASSQARSVASLGVVDTGTYTITINNGGRISKGILVIDSASYTLTFDVLDNIVVEHTQLMRIPPHTIWGYASYADASKQPVANKFVDSFLSLGASHFTGAPGYYGYFSLADTTVTINTTMMYPNARTFIYHYPGDLNLVPAMVDSFGRNNDGAQFATWTASGYYFVWPQLVYLQSTH